MIETFVPEFEVKAEMFEGSAKEQAKAWPMHCFLKTKSGLISILCIAIYESCNRERGNFKNIL